MNLPIKYRHLEEGDEAFVFNAWLKSYKDSPLGKTLVNDVFYSNHKLIVKNLIGDAGVDILLAVNPENESQIYGFACIEVTPTVTTAHYVYVKYSFRKLGIALGMVREIEPDTSKIKFVTHLPRDWRDLVQKWEWVYNPYLLYKRRG
jgi:hypothetical protein